MNNNADFPYHFSSTVRVNATATEAFSFLDDPKRISSHMGKSSMMMAGSKMKMKLDKNEGRGVGAEIILTGKMLGIPLYVREFVTQSENPVKKVWETKGLQKLVIMDQYRMGFEILPSDKTCELKVHIDYSLPPRWPASVLGKLFGMVYAKWCTEKIARDAAAHFRTA